MHGAEVIAQGFHFGMLTIAVLGALFITGEYSTGMVRSTFAAVPTRIPVLAAKALTLTALTAAVTLLPERAQNGHHSPARSIASKASANRPIPLHGAVLVDQGRPHAGVAHLAHQLAGARPRGRRKVVPGMSQIVEVQPCRHPGRGLGPLPDRGEVTSERRRPRTTPRNTRPSGPDSAKVSRWCTQPGHEPDRQSDRPHTGTRLGAP